MTDELNKLDKSIINECLVAKKQLDDLESKVYSRINYITKQIYIVFGQEDKWDYWTYDGESYGYDTLIERLNEDTLDIRMRGYFADNLMIILNGEEWDLEFDGIPTSWLFENFEGILKQGYKNYIKSQLDQQKKQAKKQKQKEKKKEQLIQSAKEKLSFEELQALIGK